MKNVKISEDMMKMLEALPPKEFKAVLLNLMEYAKTGETPQMTGVDAIIFDIFKVFSNHQAEVSERRKAARKQRERDNKTEKETEQENEKETKKESSKEKRKEKDKEQDKEKEKTTEKEGVCSPEGEAHKGPHPRPTREEVLNYCRELGGTVDGNRFYDYYSANGWRRGNSKIEDWKAAVRYWDAEDREKSASHNNRFNDRFDGGSFQLDDFYSAAIKQMYPQRMT